MSNQQPRVVAALPGGGWRVTRTYEDGTACVTPLVGWLVYEDGTVEPIDTDGSGWVESLRDESPSDYEVTVTHPDERVIEPQPRKDLVNGHNSSRIR